MTEFSLFNVMVSLLILVFGFLLNRVFSEIDKLHKSSADLRVALPEKYLSKDDFLRHAEEETRVLDRLTTDLGKRFDKLDILLEAVRVKQNIQ